MYLSGMVLMGRALVARHLAEVQVAVVMAAVWTGMLLLVSLFHLDNFDFGHTPVWFWFGAYIAYPLIGAWLGFAYRDTEPPAGAAAVPHWVRAYLAAQAIACLVLAALLFFAAAWMTSLWPWKISVLLVQIYAGPFLSYGIGSFLLSRRTTWVELRIGLAAMLTFAVLVLVASLIHRASFGTAGISAAVWFGGFAIAAAFLLLVNLRPLRNTADA